MNLPHLAELAALSTALLWSFSSIFFTVASQRFGAFVVNRVRLLIAVLIVGILHWFTTGTFFPVGESWQRYGWLAASAFAGLVVGDTLLFQSYRLIGARLGMLVLSLNPIFGALMAWMLLGENLSTIEVAAMTLALGGAAWVVLERSGANGAGTATERRYALGIALALGGAFGQALNLILAKQALGDGFSPLSAVVVRMLASAIMVWGWTVARGRALDTFRQLRADRGASLAILGGAVSGPVLGVWMSMVAIQGERIGVASTLMSMTPIAMLPFVGLIFKERISPRAVVGTGIAMAGIALMIAA